MNWDDLQNVIVENIRAISVVVGAVVVALILGAVLFEYQAKQETKAVEALFNARQAIESDKNMQTSAKVQALEEVVKSYSGSRAAYEALLVMGDTLMDAKNTIEAVAAYGRAVDAAKDDFAKVMAIYNKATAEEIGGEYESALNSYTLVLAQSKSEFLKPEIMMAQARCMEKTGKNEEAIALYQKIQDEFPNKAYYANSANVFFHKLKKLTQKN